MCILILWLDFDFPNSDTETETEAGSLLTSKYLNVLDSQKPRYLKSWSILISVEILGLVFSGWIGVSQMQANLFQFQFWREFLGVTYFFCNKVDIIYDISGIKIAYIIIILA